MASIKSKTIVLAAAILSAIATANTVTLYDGTLFQGESVTFPVSYQGNGCTNVPSWFNDRASSATWDLDHRVNGWIGLFEHENCQGRSIWWNVDGNGSPNYLPTDNFDNIISSIQFSRDPDDYGWPSHTLAGRSLVSDEENAANSAPVASPVNFSEPFVDGKERAPVPIGEKN